MTRTFTGRHMTAILVAGFGIVIAVNLVMARFAVTTFGGVVVENSYVASQEFNQWLERADRSRALGWQPSVTRLQDGRIRVAFDSASSPSDLLAIARHPLGGQPDTILQFTRVSPGQFVSERPLSPGRWTIRLEGRAGNDFWRGEVPLR